MVVDLAAPVDPVGGCCPAVLLSQAAAAEARGGGAFAGRGLATAFASFEAFTFASRHRCCIPSSKRFVVLSDGLEEDRVVRVALDAAVKVIDLALSSDIIVQINPEGVARPPGMPTILPFLNSVLLHFVVFVFD